MVALQHNHTYIIIYVKTYQFKIHCKDDCDDITPLKQQKSFWVTLGVAMHGAAYGRPMRSPI